MMRSWFSRLITPRISRAVSSVRLGGALIASVDLPVNVLARADTPPVAELATLGVKRVSVGGGFAFAAYGAVVQTAAELLREGTYGFTELSAVGSKAARAAFVD